MCTSVVAVQSPRSDSVLDVDGPFGNRLDKDDWADDLGLTRRRNGLAEIINVYFLFLSFSLS